MHLTRYSDYSLRALIFLATTGGKLCTIPEIASGFGISRGHLMKVVHLLGQLGYVETLRGRGGGIRLGMAPSEIRIGQLLRQTEESFELVDCLATRGERSCRIASACKLRGMFEEALRAFLGTLDQYTLADIVEGRVAPLKRLLQIA
ncbi:MAG TPA: Rrf2 family transcriptional regulator [Polyangiaceae bacterium]|jgi:Rrf2 family nitric oxide-sensitive transcriptional repressor